MFALYFAEAHAEFTLKLRDVIVRESDTATLLVEVTRETFEVRWMKDGQTLKPTDRFIMEKEGCRRRLIIKDTSLEDRGMYTCVLDEKTCSSTLTVESKCISLVRVIIILMEFVKCTRFVSSRILI